MLDNVQSLSYFLPELVLSAGVLLLFVFDLLIRTNPRRVALLAVYTFGLLLLAAVAAYRLPVGSHALFMGLTVHDPLALFFKYLFLGAAALAVWLAVESEEIASERMGEYFALLLSITVGMCLMASSTHLLMIYLSIELVSIVSYVLSGYKRSDRKASEASLKYVIYGGVASGVMLFGMSYLYGLFGTLDLLSLAPMVKDLSRQIFLAKAFGGQAAGQLALVVAVIFILAGVGYKIASVPWHMWCPDVYEGAPTPFTAFLSVGPKAAGFAVAIRFFYGALAEPGAGGVASAVGEVPWPAIIGIVSAVTMTLGNFAALNQTNLKRLLAYSSIAHAGYLLMGLSTASEAGNLGVMVYLVIYVLMNVGAFAVVGAVSAAGGGDTVMDCRGLAKRAPVAAITFAIFLFSLTGLPPLAGFVGKFYLFAAVVAKGGTWYWVLAVIGVLNSAISLYYYARIVKAMFLEKPFTEERIALSGSLGALLSGLATAVVLFGVAWSPLADLAQRSLGMYRPAAPVAAAFEAPAGVLAEAESGIR